MISVVIVSSKTEKQLLSCLESLCASAKLFVGTYEIIILFNHPKTVSFSEVEKLASANRNIRLILSDTSKPLSVLKNQGVSVSRGSIVAFTDDDCMVGEKWLSVIENNLADKEIWGFGPVQEYGKDSVFLKGKSGWLLGNNNNGAYAVGSNMAFSRKLISQYKFNEQIGPGTNYPLGEDYQLAFVLEKQGYTGVMLPDMQVLHNVESSKKTVSAVFSRCRNEARMLCFMFGRKVFVKRLVCLILFPFMMLLTFSLNPFFRAVVSFCYFLVLFKGEEQK